MYWEESIYSTQIGRCTVERHGLVIALRCVHRGLIGHMVSIEGAWPIHCQMKEFRPRKEDQK